MSQPKSPRPTPSGGQPNADGAGAAGAKGPVRTSAIKAARQSGPATVTVEQDSAGSGRSSSAPGSASTQAKRPTPSSGGSAPASAGATSGSGPAATSPRPATANAPARPAGPRRVRLSVSRIDPWSVMKLGFLLSVAAGIMTVVAAAVSWTVLDSMGVFADLQSLVSDLGATAQFGPILEYLKLNNIMSMATIVAVVNVALITALSTLFAFLYNIVAALVGGLHMTLTDD